MFCAHPLRSVRPMTKLIDAAIVADINTVHTPGNKPNK